MRKKLKDLAEKSLNGREIRNAISTARQLARSRKQQRSYDHLQTIVSESNKVELYIENSNLGYSED
ncbi:hypothetical protein BGZ63DRAFT_389693 [Mariannaea sp. PMI_226]|nr:hypothetical protein BGZ63DRAFT_389693 [Mariannaea sp. PMI_226]